MTTVPQATNQASLNNLCEDATHRYGCWYSLAGEMLIGKQALAGGAWTTHQIAGAARTALALPADSDGHCYPAIGIDSSGRLHVMANMHNDALQYIRQNTAGDITAWSVGPSLPSNGGVNTYPTFIHRPDGSLRVYLRDVGFAGRGDARIWDWTGSAWSAATLLFQGNSVPNGKGPGVVGDSFAAGDTAYNWSPYQAVHVEEAGAGWVEHWAVLWRVDDTGDVEDPADRHNVVPCYVQYRSATSSWHAVDGTAVTPPFDLVNQPSIQTGQVAGDEGYVNLISLSVTAEGWPHIILSQDPWYRIVWNGSSWVQTRMGNPAPSGSWQMNGFNLVSRVDPVRVRGDIWYSATSWSSGGSVIRPRMWRADGTCTASLGGDVTSNWAVMFSDQAWQKRGTVERLTPNGDTPVVVKLRGRRPDGGRLMADDLLLLEQGGNLLLEEGGDLLLASSDEPPEAGYYIEGRRLIRTEP